MPYRHPSKLKVVKENSITTAQILSERFIGWSNAACSAEALAPKQHALAALAALPAFEPVASIDYHSQGRLLVLAADARVTDFAKKLPASLSLSVLWQGSNPAPVLANADVVTGKLSSLSGYLGKFDLVFASIDGARELHQASFDLVLDLNVSPHFQMASPPQGFLHAPDAATLEVALAELPDMVGEFDKPKFFAYKESLCAHSRSKITGCHKCIDICSTQAISSDGDKVKVDPHLCMGCGACSTVCPSGAMAYQYPRASDRGAQLRALIGGFGRAAPTIMFHNGVDGAAHLTTKVEAGRGVPADVLPIETWHVAAIGLDVLLGSIAYGAAHVAVLAAGSETPAYAAAVKKEMVVAEQILAALGYSGKHFSWLDSADALWDLPAGSAVNTRATFHLSNDKRGTLEMVIGHLVKEGKTKPAEIALPAGSMYGSINVDKQKCTMCLACAGACPESALMDGGEVPLLKFLERNCVQCGLCEKTCPEKAITLTPRLLLTEDRKREVVLNESEPFGCISCGKSLGTKVMIENMLGKLVGHSMFAGEGKLNRLKMCADCRVVDMMSNKNEMSILTGKNLE